jgi:2-dehydropantoate 2-reductase
MLIDREQGRPMEVDAILGEPLRRARAAGCATPHLAQLHDALQRTVR